MNEQNTDSRTLSFAAPGNVLSTTAPLLRMQLTTLFEQRTQPFELLEMDLRAARMVDSVGLNLLVWAWKTARSQGARLRVRIASPDIERTFRFTRLSNYIDVVKDFDAPDHT